MYRHSIVILTKMRMCIHWCAALVSIPGYIGSESIMKESHDGLDNPECVLIIRFRNIDTLEMWMKSLTRIILHSGVYCMTIYVALLYVRFVVYITLYAILSKTRTTIHIISHQQS